MHLWRQMFLVLQLAGSELILIEVVSFQGLFRIFSQINFVISHTRCHNKASVGTKLISCSYFYH